MSYSSYEVRVQETNNADSYQGNSLLLELAQAQRELGEDATNIQVISRVEESRKQTQITLDKVA